jgi:hypothetical protein
MKYFASVSQLSPFGSPDDHRPGSWTIGLEVGWIPSLSEAERTVGFGGVKTEDLNRSSIFVRPRLLIGLPHGISLELGYVPPVDLDGVEPNLAGLAVRRSFWQGASARVGGRLIAQYGTFEGDFTCSADEIDRGPNPFNCEGPSSDEMTLRSTGLELSAARRLGAAEQFEPYVAVTYTEMDLDFQVDARYNGILDRTLLLTDGDALSVSAGLGVDTGERGHLVFELFYSPLDVVRPPSTATQSDDLFNVRAFYRHKLR